MWQGRRQCTLRESHGGSARREKEVVCCLVAVLSAGADYENAHVNVAKGAEIALRNPPPQALHRPRSTELQEVCFFSPVS